MQQHLLLYQSSATRRWYCRITYVQLRVKINESTQAPALILFRAETSPNRTKVAAAMAAAR
jgi:hypothetical protein